MNKEQKYVKRVKSPIFVKKIDFDKTYVKFLSASSRFDIFVFLFVLFLFIIWYIGSEIYKNPLL